MVLTKQGRLQLIEAAIPRDDFYETHNAKRLLSAASESYHITFRRLQQELLHIMKEFYTFFKALETKFTINTQGGIGRLRKELWANIEE
ncbi:hypothetical protein SARC_02222 [Sphaeroforma arctica JP610]|uniref:Uncharacterized protein n=1 Tax=Sphaeroforma arctica JP610 TaxID=667725 RepID=A0A0L0G9Q9_9EUKA|nr:hypothetical protein SARC_02222 [Sphaeroforma arctica JP610]KNC85601.1 hypothetical protein SARC_02222 [Sphaeroforma arctica JP610]|eukprot:XP_014159503.1 hypothetical protein SARC_02222 [Sphaeroforma arctica JP610]